MSYATETQLRELEKMMSRIPREGYYVMNLLAEFGVHWQDVAKIIRDARMAITSSTIARVICATVAKRMPADEMADIIAKLRLKLAAVQKRVWHVINLVEPVSDKPCDVGDLQERIMEAVRNSRVGKNKTPQVQTAQVSGLVFISVQLRFNNRCSAPLYMATPLGIPVALTSSVRAGGLLKAAVQGLGYNAFVDAKLNGPDISSLLQIHAGSDENMQHLTEVPLYDPRPQVSSSGIDYTNRKYNEQYIDTILGPNPPLLTELQVRSTKMFFDKASINKTINLNVHIKSDDIAKTLKSCVTIGALNPTSMLFNIYQKKSNNIEYYADSEVDNSEVKDSEIDDSHMSE